MGYLPMMASLPFYSKFIGPEQKKSPVLTALATSAELLTCFIKFEFKAASFPFKGIIYDTIPSGASYKLVMEEWVYCKREAKDRKLFLVQLSPYSFGWIIEAREKAEEALVYS